MAKPKRKPVKGPKAEPLHRCHIFYGMHAVPCTCKPLIGSPVGPSDTARLDALLRWFSVGVDRVFAGPAGVFVHSGTWKRIRTRRDIDNLLREARRAK